MLIDAINDMLVEAAEEVRLKQLDEIYNDMIHETNNLFFAQLQADIDSYEVSCDN